MTTAEGKNLRCFSLKIQYIAQPSYGLRLTVGGLFSIRIYAIVRNREDDYFLLFLAIAAAIAETAIPAKLITTPVGGLSSFSSSLCW